jgi:hypothetical protein
MGTRNNGLTSQEGHYIAIALWGISSFIVVGHYNNSSIDTILLIAYAQPSEDNNAITAALGEPFQLRINQTTIIIPNNMSIRLLDVPEDSRCPAFVVCVWPGQVTVSLNVTESSFPEVLNLTLWLSPSNSSSANVDSHILELLQVEPHPIRDEQILISDYRVTLKIKIL